MCDIPILCSGGPVKELQTCNMNRDGFANSLNLLRSMVSKMCFLRYSLIITAIDIYEMPTIQKKIWTGSTL